MRHGATGASFVVPPVAALAAFLTLVLSGCGGDSGGGEASAEEVAQGKTLFVSTCATCHGADAHGMPKLGKDLHDNAFVTSMSIEESVDFLKEGRPAFHPDNERRVDMPPRGGNPALSDEDLRLISIYVKSIQ